MNIPAFTDPKSPRAPFRPGCVPAAAWFNVETVFAHTCPNPEAMLRAHGIKQEDKEPPLACCARHGLDREVATPATLARLADKFRLIDSGGRGLLLTLDHSSFQSTPTTRAAGWIRALHADGAKLWAWVELTPYGHDLVNAGEFVYFSSEYAYADFAATENGAEPGRLNSCTLTNGPRHTAQTPCTNMQTQAITCTTEHTHMNTDPDKDKTPATNTTEPEPTQTNSITPPDKGKEGGCESATNGAEPPKQEPAATNTDTAPEETEPAATNTDTAPNGEDINATIVAVAELLGLPDNAGPADLLAAVKNLARSNEELRAALAEANKNASMNGGNATNAAHSVRYPRLMALNTASAGTPLAGTPPNKDVTVSVGSGTCAVNCQDKERADFCANAVTAAERALGRTLTPAEYNRTWRKANSDFIQGVNR